MISLIFLAKKISIQRIRAMLGDPFLIGVFETRLANA